jgi:hypothetical protein
MAQRKPGTLPEAIDFICAVAAKHSGAYDDGIEAPRSVRGCLFPGIAYKPAESVKAQGCALHIGRWSDLLA